MIELKKCKKELFSKAEKEWKRKWNGIFVFIKSTKGKQKSSVDR